MMRRAGLLATLLAAGSIHNGFARGVTPYLPLHLGSEVESQCSVFSSSATSPS